MRVVFLNGAFGVGKSTVAMRVACACPAIVVFDPERIGYVLRRLPGFVPGSTKHLDDYQDAPLWRRLTAALIAHRARRHVLVLVPMTFSRRAYLDEIRSGLLRAGADMRELCLLASDEVLRGRLAARGVAPDSAEGRWVYPRAMEAAAIHRRGSFGAPIATDDASVELVTERVLQQIRQWDGGEKARA